MKANTGSGGQHKNTMWISIRKDWPMHIVVFRTILYFIIFQYFPMYGLQIAFKDFIAAKGITGSDWVGFKHFIRFFNSDGFWSLLRNALLLNLYELVITFPIPIIYALMLNQVPR